MMKKNSQRPISKLVVEKRVTGKEFLESLGKVPQRYVLVSNAQRLNLEDVLEPGTSVVIIPKMRGG